MGSSGGSAGGGGAPLDSPAFTNNPTAPTQAVGNDSTRLANTAFVQAAFGQQTFPVRKHGVLVSGSSTQADCETNTVTLQAAIAAASVAGGGIVDVPLGTYYIRRPLFLPSKVTLRGAGIGLTTITKRASVKSLLTANASALATSVTVTDSTGFAIGDPIHLSDTTSYEWLSTQGTITNVVGNVITFTNAEGLGRTGLDGNLQTTRTATAYTSFPLIRNEEGSTNVVVSNMTLDQAKGANDPAPTSASVNGVADFTIATIHWVETYNSIVENCELLNASGDAYSDQAQDGTGITPAANLLKKTKNTIRGCKIRDASRHGVHLGTCMDGAWVLDNEIKSCGWYAVFYCAYACNSIARGNRVEACGSGFAGIDSRDTGNIIANNEIIDTVLWAIEASDGASGGTLPFSLEIVGNIITSTVASKGMLIGCPNTNVVGNTITNVASMTDFVKITADGDRANLDGNIITQATAASGGMGISLIGCDDVRITGGIIRGVQNGVAVNGCARMVATGVAIVSTTARDWWFATAASTDCRIDGHQGTRAVGYDEDLAPVRLVFNGLGDNTTFDPASGGGFNAVTGKRWNGTMVRWNSGGGEKVSIYFMGVGWTVLN